eukprot:CAMPEP_0175918828 /NCGR_PEP_ID=MMETSP0108-20121206/12083_1 /TAXON_ID=195067 ORGANISM="Goniomonas pacifica, Strain CCMP1869" /NCGR_SAMPLE_ID=MMETSP0108 /ASSEMBLY_ACC=CAM_ASM_000204 /LENGTH=324 /DNA_ID=CAMNT_0017241463 /DNA_START=1 /DNA_END=975 /DNA_ORIENTATION=-
MNGLTANLHLMLVAFFRPSGQRNKILMESKPFPSDLYAVQSQLTFHGLNVEECLMFATPSAGDDTLRTDDIIAKIEEEGDRIAVVMLSGVQYYTGQLFDIPRITAAAQAKGCVVGWDLAHAVGNAHLHLHDWGVDFACWCTYKYLNSGPGGLAGAFVHERYADDPDRNRFAGWWGHDEATRFDMTKPYRPEYGAKGFQLSNPPILQAVSLLASLELVHEAGGMTALRRKSELLTGYLEVLLSRAFTPEQLRIITPSDPASRGCQLSLLFQVAIRPVFEQLEQRGVVCDMREPNVIRVAPVPLYNTFTEVKTFVDILRTAVASSS